MASTPTERNGTHHQTPADEHDSHPTSQTPHQQQPPHILIIGAGIIGLTLAQSLLKNRIPFTIHERDPNPTFRGAGWGLTLHWALPTFESLLPAHLVSRLEETFVDPEASRKGDGKFLFIEMGTGEVRWSVPPNRRIRVRREALRALLMEGVDVQWNKPLTTIATCPSSGHIKATFADGSEATGTLLIGCDGARSRVRALLCPGASENKQLPVRLIGARVRIPAEKAEKLRAVDPFLFQGSDRRTDVFQYFSFLDTPTTNHSQSTPSPYYTAQLTLSYPHRPSFLSRGVPTDLPSSPHAQIHLMKEFTRDWAEPFRSVYQDLEPDTTTEVKGLELADWIPPKMGWANVGLEKVTLAGDAAHAMTMYRGEACNHGIEDISSLLTHLLPLFSPSPSSSSPSPSQPSLPTPPKSPPHALSTSPKSPPNSSPNSEPSTTTTRSITAALRAYEAEMLPRARKAVLASRRACLDAHEFGRIGEGSPLIGRRAVVCDQEEGEE